ncbi:hypothetical protein GCM10022261_17440 [Brevibacterium daeguense]|uniref:Uncharacterized protein n=1 Tax=Brevibacterium daeguense TaxID=909936 RepID=A0ABP8EJU0_9MICO
MIAVDTQRPDVRRTDSSGYRFIDMIDRFVFRILGPANRGTDADRAKKNPELSEADRVRIAREHGDTITYGEDGKPIFTSGG